MTRVDRASPSTSSQTMIRGFFVWWDISMAGMMDWMLVIFVSLNRTKASWYSALAPLAVLIKYGEMKPLSNFMGRDDGLDVGNLRLAKQD